ncbi:MAG: hypothetical protein EBS01_05025, partial [Verrucomicrobia bacterium]|nr:hypothetical protein [Verrucomicrobiota bacterium]
MYSEGVLTVSSGSLSLYWGGGGLVKAGSSDTLLLSGSGTFGNVTLNAGTMIIQSAGGFNTGILTLSGGSLGNTSGGGLSYAGLSQRWNGDFTYMGPYNLTSGGSVTLLQSSTLTVLAGSLIQGGVIFGGTSADSPYYRITKKGAGTLQLNGVGNFSGGLTLSGGTVNAGVSSALGSGSVAVNSASILNLGITKQLLEGLVLGGTDDSGIFSSGYVFGGTIAAKSYTLSSGSITSALNTLATIVCQSQGLNSRALVAVTGNNVTIAGLGFTVDTANADPANPVDGQGLLLFATGDAFTLTNSKADLNRANMNTQSVPGTAIASVVIYDAEPVLNGNKQIVSSSIQSYSITNNILGGMVNPQNGAGFGATQSSLEISGNTITKGFYGAVYLQGNLNDPGNPLS